MTLSATLQARWKGVSRREQRLLVAAAALVALALLWWIGLAPPLAALRSVDTQRAQLDVQMQQMQRLQAQAQALQAQPPMPLENARRMLESALKPLGPVAQMTLAGERVTVQFKGISPDALAQWLTQVRLNARAAPSEARLVRGPSGNWDGSVVLVLAGR